VGYAEISAFPMRYHSVACGTTGLIRAANAIGYAIHYSRSHHAVIRVYDETGNVIETHAHAGDFNEFV
jgi:hypothetical protein